MLAVMGSYTQIELEARLLLADIEKHADSLWPNTPPGHRLHMCDPEAACRLLGLAYLPDQHLGSYGGTATAGMLDRNRKAVMLSWRQPFEELRFTAAHEVGHWMLHAEQTMFRDRAPSSYAREQRPPMEREADHFAAVFLMPPKLLVAEFLKRFRVNLPLTNTNTVCFNLSVRNAEHLQGLPAGSIEFARAVANAESFNGVRFENSLARLFEVTPSAMAIRLQELNLVH